MPVPSPPTLTADAIAPPTRNACSKSMQMADDMLDAKGNVGMAVEALERGVTECLKHIGFDFDGQPVVKHILWQVIMRPNVLVAIE